jgi:hypothetical protein
MLHFMPEITSDTPETDTPTASTAKVPPKIAAAYLAALRGSALPGEGDDMDKGALADASQFAARAALDRAAETPSLLLEPIAADGTDRRMRLVIINDDMPFLVDSTSQVVASQGLAVHRILHPVVAVKRDAKGHLQEAGEGPARESVIYMELERGDARARRRLLDAVEAALRDVRAAVRDWRAMRAAMLADAAMRVEGEAAELLRWFEGGAMTQLGHEWRTRDGKVEGPLGISESADGQLLSPAALEGAFAWFDAQVKAGGGTAPLLIKSNRLSAVHRRVLLDLVVVPEMKGNKVERLSIHAGLWTSAALSARPDKVPVLRAQLEALMAKFGFDPTGHAGKALAHALTALPHDLLIAFDAASLEELVLTSMSITDRPRPKLVTVRSALGRHLFVFVWLPRDEVSTGRRLAVETMLVREAKAGVIGWTMVLEDGGAALLRYTLDLRSGGVVPDTEALNAQLEQMVRGWQPEVEAALAKRGDPGRAAALAARFGPLFPPNYRNLYNPEEAARDILRLRDLDAENPRSVRLARKSLDGDDRLRLKVYSAVGPLALSDVVPALEHFGFEVLEEIPTTLGSARVPGSEDSDETPLVIHDFSLRLPATVDELALLPYASIRRASRACTCASARSRAAACAGPTAAGLPHRGARPGEGAAGQERRHRAGRRQGRLLCRRRCPAAATATRSSPQAESLSHLHPFAAVDHRQSRRRQGRAAEGRPPRRRRPLFRRRRRQGHGDLLRYRQCAGEEARLLARRRLRLGGSAGYDHKKMGITATRRLGGGEAPLPRDGRRHPDHALHAWSASATCRATCSATACCCRRRSGSSLRSTIAISSSIPIRIRRRARRAPAPVRAAAVELAGLRRQADLEGRHASFAQPEEFGEAPPVQALLGLIGLREIATPSRL